MRFGSMVSTCRKSTATIPAAWACRNCRQLGPDRRGAGSMPEARRISHIVDGATVTPELHEFAVDPAVSPQRILPRQADDKAGDARDCRRAPWLAQLARVVLLCRQHAMPGQQRRWRHGEDFGPAPARYKPRQRGEPGPVSRLVPHPAGVPAQYRVLMPEYQQLSILRPVAAEHQDGQAEHPARKQVHDLEHAPGKPTITTSSLLAKAQVLNRVFERYTFRASSVTRACSAGEPSPAATRRAPTSLRSRPAAWDS